LLYYPVGEQRKLSSFEVFVLLGSIFLGLRAWSAWYPATVTVNRLQPIFQVRFALFVAPAICVLLLVASLLKLAAREVRNDLYIALYAVLGAAWLGGSTQLFALLGISARDDALERRNRGALIAICGALLGATLSFVGANIGDGPGVEAVLFCGILSGGAFFGLWAAVERMTSISETVTIERNIAAGIRLCGFLIGLGLLSGWAVAGNWVSWTATALDFGRSLWPGALLCAVMIPAELILRKIEPQRAAELGTSVATAILYVVLACGWVLYRGVAS
jgi:hypothetical protein